MSGLPTVALSGLVVALVAMTLLWLVSVELEDASIVDPFWGPGFVIVSLTYFVVGGGSSPRGRVALVLVTAWAVRLGYHLLVRNRREGEDKRYAEMREKHGERFRWVSLFTVFWLQAVVLWIVSAPLLGAIVGTSPLGPWDLAGAALFAVGLCLEAVADSQLARFRADPASEGRVLDTGLWRYSRHPKYFGEAVLWWGFYLFAVGAGAYWTVLGPLLITFLLLRVSGVTLLEKHLERSKPGYAEYAQRTSAFVPWPPRKKG